MSCLTTSEWSVTYAGEQTDFDKLGRAMRDYGFARVENVFEPLEVADMQSEIAKVVDAFEPRDHPTAVFTTHDDQKHASDHYFIDSVDKISFFYEEGAVDTQNGACIIEKQRALNKIGHALHWLNPIFRKYTFSERIQTLFRGLRFVQPKVVQSMYIFKQPSIGGAVTPHVDATFLHTALAPGLDVGFQPKSIRLAGVWIALDSATIDNGCLHFVPGSHKTQNDFRFIRNDSPNESSMLKFVGTKPDYNNLNYVPVSVGAGSLVLIDGQVVHKSEANLSSKSRHAYTFHVFEQNDAIWPATNWIHETMSYKFPMLYKHTEAK